MPDRWITATEYAAKYGLCRRTPANWAKQGKIRSIRKGKDWLLLDPNILEIANPASRVFTEEDVTPLIRPKEAAQLAGVHERTLRHYAEIGKIGCCHVGRVRRYSINDIREVMAIRRFNKSRVSPDEKRITIMEWARTRLGQQKA